MTATSSPCHSIKSNLSFHSPTLSDYFGVIRIVIYLLVNTSPPRLSHCRGSNKTTWLFNSSARYLLLIYLSSLWCTSEGAITPPYRVFLFIIFAPTSAVLTIIHQQPSQSGALQRVIYFNPIEVGFTLTPFSFPASLCSYLGESITINKSLFTDRSFLCVINLFAAFYLLYYANF